MNQENFTQCNEVREIRLYSYNHPLRICHMGIFGDKVSSVVDDTSHACYQNPDVDPEPVDVVDRVDENQDDDEYSDTEEYYEEE